MLPIMIFVSIFLGGLGLAGVLWGLKNEQFDDPEGSRYRILFDDEEEDRYQENLKSKKREI